MDISVWYILYSTDQFGCALITADLVDHPVHHLALDPEPLEHLVDGVCVLLLHARETSLPLAVLKVSQPPLLPFVWGSTDIAKLNIRVIVDWSTLYIFSLQSIFYPWSNRSILLICTLL